MPDYPRVNDQKLTLMQRIAAWRYFPQLCLSVIWILMVLLVYPVGDFPLNDTWAFSSPVKKLLDTGSLELSDWPFMSLIVHILWGYMVSFIFGFSYTILRCSVAFLGLVGLWGLYSLLRGVSRNRQLAFLGTLVLAVNPIFFNLACTFMTDVPFLTYSILSYLLLITGMRKENRLLIAGGILLACAATLIRQTGLIIPLSFCFAYVYQHRFKRHAVMAGLLAVAAVFCSLAAYDSWLYLTGNAPLAYRAYEGQVAARLGEGPGAWWTICDSALVCLVYFGLFLLPVLLLFFTGGRKTSTKRVQKVFKVILLLGWTLFLIIFFMHQSRLMPSLRPGGIFYDFGLGPPTLRDVFWMEKAHLPVAPHFLMIMLTAAGALGSGLLLNCIFRWVQTIVTAWKQGRTAEQRAWLNVMALSAFAMHFAALALLSPFDRYLLPCVPLLLLLMLNVPPDLKFRFTGWRRVLSLVCLAGFAVFGIGGTHDYFTWNRVRWKAIRHLTENLQIPPTKIDGGFEFNGLYLYDYYYDFSDWRNTSWWWVEDDEYIIAFGPINHYQEQARHGYNRWLPPGRGWIYTLRRRPEGVSEIVIAATRRHGGQNRKLFHADPIRYWRGDGNSAPVALSYGDYVDLEPGRYEATLHYMAQTPERTYRGSWGQFNLVEFDNGPRIVGTEINPVPTGTQNYRTQSVFFSLDEPRAVEVQIIGGDAQLWLYKVVITRKHPVPGSAGL